MELDELQKIWDKQNNKTMYTLDEQAFNTMINRKKNSAITKARLMEWILVGANGVAGSALLISHLYKGHYDIAGLAMGIIMVLTAFVILYFRSQRLARADQFAASVAGELAHGLSDALYVVRMSRTMQIYFACIVVLMVLAIGTSLYKIILVIAFGAITLYVSGWEHKWYVRKYAELKKLRSILENG